MPFAWLPPSDIVFCRPQILWLMKQENWDELLEDKYPPDPAINNTEFPSSVSTHASYEMARMIRGEINKRLESCGKTGELAQLEAYIGLSFNSMKDSSQDVIAYISGRRRKQSFVQWLADTRYRNDKKYRLTVACNGSNR